MKPYGFWIVGACTENRRLVDWRAAFSGYASLDERAGVNREAYLSAFTFGEDFGSHLEMNNSTKGFNGVCGADWLWFDIDRADLEAARRDAVRLTLSIVERYSLDHGQLLVFFSGSKGFHVGLSTGLWLPKPSLTFNKTARRFAEMLAESAHIVIDGGVYDKVRAFRAPNSQHGKTGLHKRALTLDELKRLPVERILKLARNPLAFDVPTVSGRCAKAAADWKEAVRQVEHATTPEKKPPSTTNGSGRLNRSTLEFIREGATTGDRHRRLFSAAANLAEFGCPPELAHALLAEAALDSGLSPSETRRQINCGLNHVTKGGNP